MKRHLIERDLPGVGGMTPKPRVDDKTFCVCLAEDERAMRERAKLSGFTASEITAAKSVIDRMAAMS